MSVEPRGYEYPPQSIHVVPLPADFEQLFPKPTGLTEDVWPTAQINYLGFYLKRLSCKTVLIEGHYIDRDFIDDLALFYSRSLRGYPNYCQRLHFFSEELDDDRWKKLISDANGGKRERVRQFLQKSYLGFSVVRPLPGSLIGRTVLPTFPTNTAEGHRRDFGATREYRVHLAGFDLVVSGLAFQQQDQGVSACATTALWSAIHKVAPMEGLPFATPAAITQAASRYFLAGGRALPSEGLTIDQICEATRSSGLAPIVVRGLALEQARAQLHGYLTSGLPAVLALQPLPLTRSEGHAVCAVGLKLGEVAPQTNPDYHFRDVATSVMAVYVHDDRLGPYAVADLQSHTLPSGDIVPALVIRWPGEKAEFETCVLRAIIVPAPPKLRLTVARMRSLGVVIAEAVGERLPELQGRVDLSCRYRVSTEYQQMAFDFGLSDEGILELSSRTVLSRYLGVVHLDGPSGPLFDVLLDATETQANPSVLCCVSRRGLPVAGKPLMAFIARRLGGTVIG